MFTGIIEEVGTIRELRLVSEGAVLTTAGRIVPPGLKIGDSVAVSGVCLTATVTGQEVFSCDISSETLRRSNFLHARQGSKVNLERSMTLGGRLGGHIVQGHVDGIGKLISRTRSGAGWEMSFEFPLDLERYLVYKGSIAVDGVSLTIASLGKNAFSVAVIPHTLESTTLGQLRIGDAVNLETDILGKYFERFFQLGLMQKEKPAKLTAEYLRDQGF